MKTRIGQYKDEIAQYEDENRPNWSQLQRLLSFSDYIRCEFETDFCNWDVQRSDDEAKFVWDRLTGEGLGPIL
jgi:hypothetical protein